LNQCSSSKILGADSGVFDKETLGSAFKGMLGVYINLPEPNIQTAITHILQQLKNTSVEQIGYTSGCTVRKENASHPMIRAHFEAENKIMKCGIPWSIFRPTMVLDTLPAYANKGKPFIIGRQPHSWSWIHTGDMAKMISSMRSSFHLQKKQSLPPTGSAICWLLGIPQTGMKEFFELYRENFSV